MSRVYCLESTPKIYNSTYPQVRFKKRQIAYALFPQILPRLILQACKCPENLVLATYVTSLGITRITQRISILFQL